MLVHDEPDVPADDSALLDEPPTAAAETPETTTEPGDADPSEAPSDGPPRDDRGRFAPKAQDPAPEAPGTDPDGDPDGPAADDPDAPAANPASPPAAALPATEPPPGAPADQPFTFLHRGQQHGVEGAVVKADGSLVVPPTARQRVEQMLARGREAEVMGPRRDAEARQLRQQLEAKHAGVDAFAGLFADNPDAETFLARALQFYETLPALREQMTRQELEARDRRIAELEGRAPAAATPDGAPDPQAMAEEVTASLTEALGLARQALPEFQGFTDDELRGLYPELQRRAGLLFRLATAEDEATWGVPAGTIVRDDDAVAKELRLLAAPLVAEKRRAAAKAKAEADRAAAAQRNKAVLTPAKPPPSSRPAAEVPAGRGAPEFKTWEDAMRWRDNG